MELLILILIAYVLWRVFRPKDPPAFPACKVCGARDWLERSDRYRYHPSAPEYWRVQCGSCGTRVRLMRFITPQWRIA